MGNPKGLVQIGGLRMTKEEAHRDPGRLPFTLDDHERGRTADDLWEATIGHLRAMVKEDARRPGTTSCASTTSIRCTSSCAKRAGRAARSSTSR
jgi:hypothetical protein